VHDLDIWARRFGMGGYHRTRVVTHVIIFILGVVGNQDDGTVLVSVWLRQ
jgi:hypothetical protein